MSSAPAAASAFVVPKLRSVAKGLLSFPIKSMRTTHTQQEGSGSNAEFCYHLFLRHFSHIAPFTGGRMPRALAELGPGSSIGMGLAALLAGAQTYTSLDLEDYTSVERDLAIFDELVRLFRARTPSPRTGRFADIFPEPLTWEFPDSINPDLSEGRLAVLRSEITTRGGALIRMAAPWASSSVVAPGSLDWLWSHSCLEHVDDTRPAIAAIARSLRPGGLTTHEIDFRSHKLTPTWDGHWAISEPIWWALRGKRPYLINRRPCSFYQAAIREEGLEVLEERTCDKPPGVAPHPRFGLTDADRSRSMCFVVCRKPGAPPPG